MAWSVAEERVDESDALQRLAEPSRLRGSSLLSLRKHLHTDSHMKRDLQLVHALPARYEFSRVIELLGVDTMDTNGAVVR